MLATRATPMQLDDEAVESLVRRKGTPSSRRCSCGSVPRDERTFELPTGAIFARDFRIAHRIGAGGTGVVYAAEQLSTSKPRALKLMHAALVHDTRLRDSFLEEAHAAAQIESDHVAEVVAAGVDDATGMPWLAMELLRGEPLDRRVQSRGPLGPSELLALGTQLRHVLAQAHARGLVHRDLRPDNLFIEEPRRTGVPFMLKVPDLGLARWVQESSHVFGSPLWMAPEQWRSDAKLGPATDVWALALVMFFALTGRSYWRSAAHDDPSSIASEVATATLVPPGTRARELGLDVATVPPVFDEWFLSCLVRDPARRLPDADAALGAFEGLFDGVGRSARRIHFRAPELGANAVWEIVSAPLRAHGRVQRVVSALAPAIAEAFAAEAKLLGLSEDRRLERVAARLGAEERGPYEAAAAAIGEVARRLGVEAPLLFVRDAQREPLRIEPTFMPSATLGPAIRELTPPARACLSAATAAAARPELRARALVPEVARLWRFIATATRMARDHGGREPRGLLTSGLLGHVAAGTALAALLDAEGDACSEEALASWLMAVDCTLARVGLLASGRLAAAVDALTAPPMMTAPAAIDEVLGDLEAWAASADYQRARAAWGPPPANLPAHPAPSRPRR